MTAPTPLTPQRPAAHYTLRFAPLQQVLLVEAQVLVEGATRLELTLPVWTPGSYMVREYARHVESLTATGPQGQPCTSQKSRKNRWLLACDPAWELVVVHYRIHCRELSVRTNYVDEAFALVVGAATYLSAPHLHSRPHAVQVALPPSYARWRSSLPQATPDSFVAPDYDALIDAPLYCGHAAEQTFVAQGCEVAWLTEGAPADWDAPAVLADVERIVGAALHLWGAPPMRAYVFFNLLTEARGGLEHADSSVLMASSQCARSRTDYVDFLGLVSHEFFHVWNIKRLRPVELGPFDYEAENPCRSLWVAEGFTAYYDDLLVHRAGLCSESEYLTRLGRSLGRLQATPGRLVQSLSEACFDAWIKFYRRDEHTDQMAVSYYLKGSLVAFVLDAKIRKLTGNARSLDDVMRAAFARFATSGYTEAGLRSLAGEVAGHDLQAFFAQAVDMPGELSTQEALSYYGLQPTLGGDAGRAGRPLPGYAGLGVRQDGGRLVVSEVVRDGPACQAGVHLDDELVAIDDHRLPPTAARLGERLQDYAPGSEVTLLLCRRARLHSRPLRLESAPRPITGLVVHERAGAEQRKNLQLWLRGGGRDKSA